MGRLCFVYTEAFLVADFGNRRLQEATVGGELVRIIGEATFDEGDPQEIRGRLRFVMTSLLWGVLMGQALEWS